MGGHCELMAQEWKLARAEQDQFAFESHRKGAKAYAEGWMDDLVVPCAGVYRDNNLREDMTLEKMATLKNAFEKGTAGTLSAANSTPLTDGAAAVLLASEDWAKKRGLPILAYMTYSQHAANDFVAGEGLLMAPTIAVSKMLDRAGLKLQDFDFYEIHEAFAAQVLRDLEGLGRSRVLQEASRQGRGPGLDRPRETEREGVVTRLRASVRGNGRAHHRQSREAVVGATAGAG